MNAAQGGDYHHRGVKTMKYLLKNNMMDRLRVVGRDRDRRRKKRPKKKGAKERTFCYAQ